MAKAPRRPAFALTAACWALLVWLLVERTPRQTASVKPRWETGLRRLPLSAHNATLGRPAEPTTFLTAACADAWVARGEICERPLIARDAAFDVAVRWSVHPSAPAWTRRPALRYLLRSLRELRRLGRVGRVALLVDTAGLDRMVALPTWLDPDRAELNGLDVVAPPWPLRPSLLDVVRKSTAPAVLIMSSETLMPGPVASADVATPAFGPVLRLDLDAEPVGAHHTAMRFGERRRLPLTETPQVVPTATAREIAALWDPEIALEAGVDLPFLTTHYLIERHREVLLWSLIVATHDLDRSGTFSWTERASLLEWLIVNAGGAVSGDAVRIGWPNRSDDRDETDDVLAWSGFGPPGATRYDFTSAHGDPFVELPIVDYQHGRGTSCWLHIVDCFGPSFLDENMVVEVNDVMRRIVAEKPHCGSCLIVAGLGASSPAGLDGFLPSHWSARDRATAAPIAPELAMGARTIAEADYGWAAVTPQLEHFDGLRDFCVRLIQRYSFALGSSLAVRLTLRGPTADVKETLEAMTTNPPAFLELIDKVTNQRSARGLDDLLLKLGDRSWPEPAPWEQ